MTMTMTMKMTMLMIMMMMMMMMIMIMIMIIVMIIIRISCPHRRQMCQRANEPFVDKDNSCLARCLYIHVDELNYCQGTNINGMVFSGS